MTSRGKIVTAVLLFAVAATAAWFSFGSKTTDSRTVIAPFLNDRQFYESAFAAAAGSPELSAHIILVNHHLLAAGLIAQAVSVGRTGEPVTVVLISPDHFERGRAPISVSAAKWDTPYGVLEPDTDAIAALITAADLNDYPFFLEHGVGNIVPFIKKEMPDAKLVPILIKERAPVGAVSVLVRAISALPGRTIIIGSFDFTHNATVQQAEANDARSLKVLQNNNPQAIEDVAVDSRGGLRAILELADLEDLRFRLLVSTNSARLTGKLDQQDVTSYITGFWGRKQ